MSGENNLQATLTSDFGMLLSGIKQLQSEMKETKAHIKALGKATNTFQQDSSQSFRKAKEEASSFAMTMKNAGSAFSKMGGPLGGIAGRIGGAGGLAGMFGVLAGAAAAAGVAINIAMSKAEQTAAAAARTIQNAVDIAHARSQGKSAVMDQALGALGHGDALGKAVFRAGPDGIKEAEKIASIEGVSLNDASEAVSLLYNLPSEKRKMAYRAAGDASRTGMVSFSQAAKMISESDLLQTDLTRQPGGNAMDILNQQSKVAAKIVKMASSPETDIFGKQFGEGYESLIPGINAVREDPTLSKFRELNEKKAKLENAGLSNINNPAVIEGISKAIFDAINVDTKAERDFKRQREEEIYKIQLEVLDVLKTTEGRFGDLVQVLKSQVGGETPRADLPAQMQKELREGNKKAIQVEIINTPPPRSY